MTEITVARVDPSDRNEVDAIAPAVSAIVDGINAEGGDKALPARMTPDDARALIDRLADRGGLFYCRADGEVAGFATVQPDQQDPGTAIMGVWVAAPSRRRGIGTVLARAGTEFAREAGYAKLRGTIPATNEPALSFFSAVGPIVRLEGGNMGYELPV